MATDDETKTIPKAEQQAAKPAPKTPPANDAATDKTTKPQDSKEPTTGADGSTKNPPKSSSTGSGDLVRARRIFIVLAATAALAVVALVAGVYLTSGFLANKSKLIKQHKVDALVLDKKFQQLAIARASITRNKDLAAIAKSLVPQDKDQAQAVREIANLAAADGIKLGGISFPSSTLGDKKDGANSQLKAATGISGVYQLQISVQSDKAAPTSYDAIVNFLQALENNRRTALVDGVYIQPEAEQPGRISFTITLNEYIKP